MQYSKRMLLGGVSGIAIAISNPFSLNASAQDSFSINEAESMMSFNVVELKDQLYFGLRTFLPEQQAFLDSVIAKVDSGEIPRAMVNVVFVWAKKRNPKIPFPYFEVALRLLAEKRGVTF
jgi:hypothetical protein